MSCLLLPAGRVWWWKWGVGVRLDLLTGGACSRGRVHVCVRGFVAAPVMVCDLQMEAEKLSVAVQVFVCRLLVERTLMSRLGYETQPSFPGQSDAWSFASLTPPESAPFLYHRRTYNHC